MGCTSLPAVQTTFPAVSDKSQREPGPQAPACSAADPAAPYATIPGGVTIKPPRLNGSTGDDHSAGSLQAAARRGTTTHQEATQHDPHDPVAATITANIPKHSFTDRNQDTAGRNATKGGMPRNTRRRRGENTRKV